MGPLSFSFDGNFCVFGLTSLTITHFSAHIELFVSNKWKRSLDHLVHYLKLLVTSLNFCPCPIKGIEIYFKLKALNLHVPLTINYAKHFNIKSLYITIPKISYKM
jgi:hypothetical protein